MAKDWNPMIISAAVHDDKRFALAISDLSADEPFTALVTYDGNYSQPWERVAVLQEVYGIAVMVEDGAFKGFMALSSEGDVYSLIGEVTETKIDGAGLTSGHDGLRGPLYALCAGAGSYFAAGAGSQIYRRREGDWRLEQLQGEEIEGYDLPVWNRLVHPTDGQIFALGIREATGDDDALLDAAKEWEGLSADDLLEQWDKMDAATLPDLGVIARLDGEVWTEIKSDALGEQELRDATVDALGSLWFCGSDDLLLRYDGVSFEQVPLGAEEYDLLTICAFQDGLVIGHDHGLMSIHDNIVNDLKLPVSVEKAREAPAPLLMKVVGQRLCYIDQAHGVFFWDGLNWELQAIPAALWKRDFKGL